MGGGGRGKTQDCLEAESRLSINYSVVAGWWHPSRLVRVHFCSSQTQVRSKSSSSPPPPPGGFCENFVRQNRQIACSDVSGVHG